VAPISDISLRPVTRENVRAVCELEVGEDQRRLVAPAAVTVAESQYYDGSLLRAICAGETPVGVLWVDRSREPPYLSPTPAASRAASRCSSARSERAERRRLTSLQRAGWLWRCAAPASYGGTADKR
jgi:hypothetical protein